MKSQAERELACACLLGLKLIFVFVLQVVSEWLCCCNKIHLQQFLSSLRVSSWARTLV